jgi:hypothetical protein
MRDSKLFSRGSNQVTETCILLCCFFLVGCGRPPLVVRQESGSVIVDLATLGEYPTTVKRLRISNPSTNAVVWEISVSTGTPQLWKLELSLGSNSKQPPKAAHGSYTVVFPSDTEEFTLEPGVAYAVEAWGEGARPAKTVVTLEPVRDKSTQ